MSRNEENGNITTPATSELCSNSLPRRQRGNGKGECSARDTSRIPPAKAGNTAIPFQPETNPRDARPPFRLRSGRAQSASKNKPLLICVNQCRTEFWRAPAGAVDEGSKAR